VSNEQKMEGCHPTLIRKALAVLWRMDALGHPMKVTDGYRSPAEQFALYQKGRTKPGPKVTTLDGYRNRSKHNYTPGRAVDCAFKKGVNGVTWDGPWNLYGQSVQWKGLIWGGAWKRFVDRPHMEMPDGMK
jgi:peptidoglycan L-alanyl-D-glutamate endopeptidase CwlK